MMGELFLGAVGILWVLPGCLLIGGGSLYLVCCLLNSGSPRTPEEAEVARDYNVSRAHIGLIKQGKRR